MNKKTLTRKQENVLVANAAYTGRREGHLINQAASNGRDTNRECVRAVCLVGYDWLARSLAHM